MAPPNEKVVDPTEIYCPLSLREGALHLDKWKQVFGKKSKVDIGILIRRLVKVWSSSRIEREDDVVTVHALNSWPAYGY